MVYGTSIDRRAARLRLLLASIVFACIWIAQSRGYLAGLTDRTLMIGSLLVGLGVGIACGHHALVVFAALVALIMFVDATPHCVEGVCTSLSAQSRAFLLAILLGGLLVGMRLRPLSGRM